MQRLYICDLVYPHTSEDGIASDRNYELQLSYWQPKIAEEYGHAENEIDNILLMEKESKDAVLLYEVDERFTPTKDLQEFLQRDYGIDPRPQTYADKQDHRYKVLSKNLPSQKPVAYSHMQEIPPDLPLLLSMPSHRFHIIRICRNFYSGITE